MQFALPFIEIENNRAHCFEKWYIPFVWASKKPMRRWTRSVPTCYTVVGSFGTHPAVRKAMGGKIVLIKVRFGYFTPNLSITCRICCLLQYRVKSKSAVSQWACTEGMNFSIAVWAVWIRTSLQLNPSAPEGVEYSARVITSRLVNQRLLTRDASSIVQQRAIRAVIPRTVSVGIVADLWRSKVRVTWAVKYRCLVNLQFYQPYLSCALITLLITVTRRSVGAIVVVL